MISSDKNIAIVPDVHGKTFWKEVKEKVDSLDEIVFLGDYFDSYYGVSREEELKNFLEIIEFKKSYPDKVTLFLGNHDVGYLLDLRCSRQASGEMRTAIKKSFKNNLHLFKLTHCVSLGNKTYLFSHAGITKKWLGLIKNELDKAKTMGNKEINHNKWSEILKDIIKHIGWSKLSVLNYSKQIEVIDKVFSDEAKLKESIMQGFFNDLLQRIDEPDINQFMSWCLWTVDPIRGGYAHDHGSILWADSSEWEGEDNYFGENVIQIVGHSRNSFGKLCDSAFCLDSMSPKVIYLNKDCDILSVV